MAYKPRQWLTPTKFNSPASVLGRGGNTDAFRVVQRAVFGFLQAAVAAPPVTTITISDNTGATYAGVSETMGKSLQPVTPWGSTTIFEATNWDSTDVAHGFIKFDGLSSVPAGTVSNVKLRLWVVAIFDTPTTQVYGMLRDFVESQATWNQYSTGNNWGTAGANNTTSDYTNTLLSSLAITVTAQYVELTGSALTAWAQAIVSGGANLPLLLRDSSEPASPLNRGVQYATSEGVDGRRPELVFDWVAAGGGTQSLTVGLLSNTQSFFPANVTVGAITLTPPLVDNSTSFPVASVTAGAMNVVPPLLTNTTTLYGGLVTLQPLSLLPPLLASSNTLFAPTVTAGAMQVDAPLLTNTNTLYTGIVVNSQPIFPPLLSNSNSLFEPTVTLTVTLQPPLLSNSNSFPAPVVTAGAMNVVSPLLTNSNTVFAPTVTLSTNLTAPLLDNSSLNAVYAPNTSLAPYVATPPLLVNSISFLAPTVTGVGYVVAPVLTNTQSFFGASITTGAATIVPQIVANQQTFFVATVTGGVVSDNDGGMYSVIERRRRQHSRQYRR